MVERWNDFFFAPQSPVPIALFRIIYGINVIATLLLLRPDWLTWYGVHAWVSLPTMQKVEPGMRLNILPAILGSDRSLEVFFWFFLGSAVLLTAGCFTRVNSVLVFLGLTSIQQRNLYITHGGDTFLRVAGYFLIFAPAGAALSVDRLVALRRGKDTAHMAPRSPWAQRMIQFELALLYFAGFASKMHGDAWINGSALGYVYHLDELHRFPLPAWFLHPSVLKVGTWCTLGLEFSLGILIWIRRFRYPLLALGCAFHTAIDYSLNIPMFEWDVLAAYILFIDGADLERSWRWIRRSLKAAIPQSSHFGKAA